MISGVSLSFEELVADVSAGNNKIQRADYLPAGRYPIVDQGQELIGGYSNSATDLVQGTGPWIVFGDHTRALKYIDSPFCMGADGVKVLRPRSPSVLHPKYLYHYLVAHPVPSAGYSRHFKFLKKLPIYLPPIDEQRRIAAVLDKVDKLRRQRKLAQKSLGGLTQSIFRQVFANGEGTSVKLADLVDPADRINYGVIQPGDPAPDGVFLVRAGDLRAGGVDRSNLRTISAEVSAQYARSVLKGGEILIGCVGSIGEVAVARDEDRGFNIARAVARVPLAKNVSRTYVAEYLRTAEVQNYFKAELRTVAQPTLNIKQIAETRLIIPPASQIRAFENVVGRIRKNISILTDSEHAFAHMFSSLQHRVFSGQL